MIFLELNHYIKMPNLYIEIFDANSTSRLIVAVDDIDVNDTILAVKHKISLKSIYF